MHSIHVIIVGNFRVEKTFYKFHGLSTIRNDTIHKSVLHDKFWAWHTLSMWLV